MVKIGCIPQVQTQPHDPDLVAPTFCKTRVMELWLQQPSFSSDPETLDRFGNGINPDMRSWWSDISYLQKDGSWIFMGFIGVILRNDFWTTRVRPNNVPFWYLITHPNTKTSSSWRFGWGVHAHANIHRPARKAPMLDLRSFDGSSKTASLGAILCDIGRKLVRGYVILDFLKRHPMWIPACEVVVAPTITHNWGQPRHKNRGRRSLKAI